jgi:hypothetical protein
MINTAVADRWLRELKKSVVVTGTSMKMIQALRQNIFDIYIKTLTNIIC